MGFRLSVPALINVKASGQECPLHTNKLQGQSDADVHGAERIFVGFTGCAEFGVGVLFAEVGVVPFFPGEHGMVGSGQGFFRANGINPFVGGLLVGETQLIEIGGAHKLAA